MTDEPAKIKFLRVLDGLPFEIEIFPTRNSDSGPWEPCCYITGGDKPRAGWDVLLGYCSGQNPTRLAELALERWSYCFEDLSLSFSEEPDEVNPDGFASFRDGFERPVFAPKRALEALAWCVGRAYRAVGSQAHTLGTEYAEAFAPWVAGAAAEEADRVFEALRQAYSERHDRPIPYGMSAAVIDDTGFDSAIPDSDGIIELDFQRQDAALLLSLPLRFPNLRILRLPLLNLLYLPAEFAGFRQLEELVLTFNNLSDLPSELALLGNLQRFHLFGNPLKVLPPVVTELHGLRVLDLRYCPIGALPEEIGRLKNLEELYLDGCALESLPDSIGDLSRLRILSLRNNRLKRLPASLARLRSLQTLDLGLNYIERINLAGMGMRNLLNVWCDGNPLARIPKFILGLPAVQYLFLCDCALEEIPADIPAGWRDLRLLDVSRNRIRRIPGSYAELASLFVLDDWGNPLEEGVPGSLVKGVPGWRKMTQWKAGGTRQRDHG